MKPIKRSKVWPTGFPVGVLGDRPAPHNGTPTSRGAARAIRHRAQTIRLKIYDLLVSRGANGATREEVEQATGFVGNTVRPRIVELVEAHLVQESGRTRPTVAGRAASVLVAVRAV